MELWVFLYEHWQNHSWFLERPVGTWGVMKGLSLGYPARYISLSTSFNPCLGHLESSYSV